MYTTFTIYISNIKINFWLVSSSKHSKPLDLALSLFFLPCKVHGAEGKVKVPFFFYFTFFVCYLVLLLLQYCSTSATLFSFPLTLGWEKEECNFFSFRYQSTSDFSSSPTSLIEIAVCHAAFMAEGDATLVLTYIIIV